MGTANDKTARPSWPVKILNFLVEGYWIFLVVGSFILFVFIFFSIPAMTSKTMGPPCQMPLKIVYYESEAEIAIEGKNRFPAVLSTSGLAYIAVGAELWAIFIPMIIIILTLTFYLLNQFRLIVRSVIKGDPFNDENPRRLKILGCFLTLAGPIEGLIGYTFTKPYAARMIIEGAKVSAYLDLHLRTVFSGLLILALAWVFESGIKMRKEQELTI